MFEKNVYVSRREALMEIVSDGLVLLPANEEVGMNYAGNPYHFRQDSNFLYYFGIDRPGMVGLIDVNAGESWILGQDPSLEDVVWMGEQPSVVSLAEATGATHWGCLDQVKELLAKAQSQGRKVHYLPPYRAATMLALHQWCNVPLSRVVEGASEELIRAVVAQRSCKGPEEIREIERAVDITAAMHLAVMRAARPGMKEVQLAGIARGIAIAAEGEVAYPVILTVQGHILHNHYHGNELRAGQMVLGDFGAETKRHYAGDITRTFPVSGQFTSPQRDIYQIVLGAQLQAIQQIKPGVPYRDIHLLAATHLAEGLKALGLMRGDVAEAVAAGAHALFFPHGLGHMLGLDVHDMEGLGENYVGYDDEVQRSEQFGTAYLRLGKRLKAGYVLTVEPGIYFIPALIAQWRVEKRHADFINYSEVAKWQSFTGIRIEDNVLVTEEGHRVLGEPLPKQIEEIEAIRKEALES